MNPSGGFSDSLSPSATRTELDAVMYETYQRTEQPAYLSASDAFFFKQGTTGGKLGFIWEEDSNVGEFQKTGEQEDILTTDSRIGNQKTKNSQKWTKKVPISDEAFRADQVGKRAQISVNVGDRARQTQDKQAILETYGDAFSGSFNTTPDSQNLASNSHTTLTGVTVDNLDTGHATPNNLWTQVTQLANQYAQDGDAGSHLFEGIVGPFTLYKTFKEILNSELIANSAENNLNVFDTDYGQVSIKVSIFLGSTYNTYANANTAYVILGRNHMIERKVFYGLTTDLIEPRYTTNDTWQYLAKYHECVFPGSFTAIVGTTGAV